MPTSLAFKSANISDSLLSTISAMGATYPFITLSVYDGGDIFRLTSFSGPPSIYQLLTKKYASKVRPICMGPVGYSYPESIKFDSSKLFESNEANKGSRLIGVRVWIHKHINGLQLIYRRPKRILNVPESAEELWKQLEERKKEKTTDEPVDVDEKYTDETIWETEVYGTSTAPHSTKHEFNLGDNEFLTKVDINYSAVLHRLSLHTNTGRSSAFGISGGSFHSFSAFPSSAIVAFFGMKGFWGGEKLDHIHSLGVTTQEIHPEIRGDCEVLRLLGNYTYRLKEVIPMNEHKRFYIFKFQDLDDRAIKRKECLV